MAEIKLIATDLDGTFLNSAFEPNPDNVRAVKAAREAGIKVCVCTGRFWPQARQIVKDCGFDDFCITNNGASIIEVQTGKLRYRNRLNPDTLEKLLKVCADFDAGIMLFNSDFLGVYIPTMGEAELNELKFMYSFPPEYRYEQRIYPTAEEMAEECRGSAEQVILSIKYEYADALRKRLQDIGDVEITTANPEYINIMASGGTKGEALGVVADIYDIQPENVMAIGNSHNDISMIEYAGVGVAVGDAEQSLKDVADIVSLDHQLGGVAKAIYEVALGQKYGK